MHVSVHTNATYINCAGHFTLDALGPGVKTVVRWGTLASGVCTLRPAHQDLHTEVPRTPTPSCAECMKYYKTLFKETQPMYFWMPAFYWQMTMLWWQFIWTHTHTNDIWRMLKNQINMIIWIWCIMNVLAELRIENVSQAGLPKYNI